MAYERYFAAISIPPVDEKIFEIYHYTSPSGMLGILDKDGPTLWFTRYDCLNDASEGQDIIKQFEKACNSLVQETAIDYEFYRLISEVRPDDRAAMALQISSNSEDVPSVKIEKVYYDIYICCFSAGNDLLPMWNYYVKDNAYQGYNIGFKTRMFDDNECKAHTSFIDKNGYFVLQTGKIIYSDEEKQTLLRERILALFEKHKEANNRDHTINNFKCMLNSLHLLFKHEAFAHEQEIRVILLKPIKLPDSVKTYPQPPIHYREKAGIVQPYISVHFHHCQSNVDSVTIGPLSKKDIAKSTLRNMLLDHQYRIDEIKESSIPVRY